MSAIAEVSAVLNPSELYSLATTTNDTDGTLHRSDLLLQLADSTRNDDPYSLIDRATRSEDRNDSSTDLFAELMGIANGSVTDNSTDLRAIFSGSSGNVSLNKLLSQRSALSDRPMNSSITRLLPASFGSTTDVTTNAASDNETLPLDEVAQKSNEGFSDFAGYASALLAASGLLANPGAVNIQTTSIAPRTYAIDSEITAIEATADSTADDPHDGSLATHSSVPSALMIAAVYRLPRP